MSAQERLRHAINEQESRLRSCVPADRSVALQAILRALAREAQQIERSAVPDLVTGRRLVSPGGNRALQLCLEATSAGTQIDALPDASLAAWGQQFLRACSQLAEAELLLAHGESGFMRLAPGSGDAIVAWMVSKRIPASWRERADLDWWAERLATLHGVTASNDRPYRQQAEACLARMAYRTGFPPETIIGGCSMKVYERVLLALIVETLQAAGEGHGPRPQSEQALLSRLASSLRLDPSLVARAVAGFTLDVDSAAYHAAPPGVAAAPLVRIGPDQTILSTHGLTSEPLLFLTRELRRREAQEFNNNAIQREGVFRQDLYALFDDKRFVTSANRIELRRSSGTVRTDIDAVVFDRKSGTLGFFELKTQDPFARSASEMARQQENVLYANRQVSGALAWIQQHGANEILQRVDARAARTFRAQKVYAFVLGRYVAHFSDGPEPDKRAAWGTWLQVLRLLDGQPARASEGNPLASLFNRLLKDTPFISLPVDMPTQVVELGDTRVVVYPSYAAYRADHPNEHSKTT